jgi:hypothetical protein
MHEELFLTDFFVTPQTVALTLAAALAYAVL